MAYELRGVDGVKPDGGTRTKCCDQSTGRAAPRRAGSNWCLPCSQDDPLASPVADTSLPDVTGTGRGCGGAVWGRDGRREDSVCSEYRVRDVRRRVQCKLTGQRNKNTKY